MPDSSLSPHRKKSRYQTLAEKLQNDIEQGKYPVGVRLPSERVLAKEFDTTHVTIRQGVDILVRKGLVIREPGSGTYVNAQYEKAAVGILFGPRIADESAHFYRALLGSLEREVERLSFACRSYDGFNKTDESEAERSASYQQLVTDSQNHPFKGFIVISVTDPRWLERKPIRNLPKASHGLYGKDVVIDYYRFGRDCMEFVFRNGRKKVFYLQTFTHSADDLKGFSDAAEELNIPVPEYVQLDTSGGRGDHDALAHKKIEALLAQWNATGQWPDTLIVSDDIATRGVALGLIKAGIEVPSQMMVITHANEGIEHHYGLDIIRYSISPDEIARKLGVLLQKKMDDPATPVEQRKVHGRWVMPGAKMPVPNGDTLTSALR